MIQLEGLNEDIQLRHVGTVSWTAEGHNIDIVEYPTQHGNQANEHIKLDYCGQLGDYYVPELLYPIHPVKLRRIEDLRGNRNVLLFAQRGWLAHWFPDYDPSQPDQVEDTNRPWDFDHIHPQRYLRSQNGK